MSLKGLLYLFAVGMRHKLLAKPTKHQTPGKHHKMHAGPQRATGQKLARQCLRSANVRGH